MLVTIRYYIKDTFSVQIRNNKRVLVLQCKMKTGNQKFLKISLQCGYFTLAVVSKFLMTKKNSDKIKFMFEIM